MATGVSRRSGDRAADRLLDAAERLFAASGIEAVSVRAVNVAAGMNPAAVHYHFGGKPEIVRAVLDRRMAALGARRSGLLAAHRAAGTVSAAAVVDVLVTPLVEICATTRWG